MALLRGVESGEESVVSERRGEVTLGGRRQLRRSQVAGYVYDYPIVRSTTSYSPPCLGSSSHTPPNAERHRHPNQHPPPVRPRPHPLADRTSPRHTHHLLPTTTGRDGPVRQEGEGIVDGGEPDGGGLEAIDRVEGEDCARGVRDGEAERRGLSAESRWARARARAEARSNFVRLNH